MICIVDKLNTWTKEITQDREASLILERDGRDNNSIPISPLLLSDVRHILHHAQVARARDRPR